MAAIVIILTLCVGTAAAQDKPRPGALMLDFSVGMAGSLEGSPKSVVLRQLLPAALDKIDPTLQLATVVYGQRPRNGCGNVTVLQELASFDATALTQAVTLLRAHRSRTPLADALVATAAATGTGPADILAIVGSIDTCKKDPCGTVQALAAARPDLRINLIGVGLDPETSEALKCIPAATGGSLTLVNDRTALELALNAGLAGLGKGGAPGGADAPARPPELIATARLSAQAPDLVIPVDWRIEKLTDAGPAGVVHQTQQARLAQKLDAGRYRITARVDKAAASQDVEIAASGPTTVQLDLAAGAFVLRDLPQAASGILPPLLVLNRRAADGSKTTIVMEPARGQSLIVPAGDYEMTLERGATRLDRTLTIAAGSEIVETLDLATGQLSVETTGSVAGLADAPVLITISAPAPEATGGLREIARSVMPNPQFDLPPGLYEIMASQGNAKAITEIAVRGGEATRAIAALSAGTLALALRLPELAEPLADQAWVEIWHLTDTPSRILRTTRSKLNLPLASGRYRVDVGLGAGQARFEQQVDIAPGQVVALELTPELALVRLKQKGVRDVQWELRDEAGNVVAVAARPEPLLGLKPGRYQAVARSRGRSKNSSFVAVAGETMSVDVPPE